MPPQVVDHRPPAWLTAGAMPLPTKPALPTLPEPDLLSAQNEPQLSVPRVEEERSPANHSVAETIPEVTPVSAVLPVSPMSPIVVPAVTPIAPATPIAEPNWKPAGGFRAQ